MKGQVFIGTSTEQKQLGEVIGEALSALDLKPLPWWTAFEPGDYTLDKLRDLSRAVDAAVFVFGADDETWSRGEKHETARDNVVLEYGLFVASKGRHLTIIVTPDTIKLPSDLLGVGYAKGKDHRAIAKTVADHLRKHIDERLQVSKELRVIADPSLIATLKQPQLPSSWRSRALFVGLEGCLNWCAMTEASANVAHRYLPHDHYVTLRNEIRHAISHCSPNLFVSLGPGDGALDKDIVTTLKNRIKNIQYIPCDISYAMAVRAMEKLSNHVSAPIGVHCDFEENPGFAQKVVRDFDDSGRLFGLVGGTLGNVDESESTFINGIAEMMGDDDWLLIHVSLWGESWSLDGDRRGTSSGYNNAFRRFLYHGVCKKANMSWEQFENDFDSKTRVQRGSSDVPHSKCLEIYCDGVEKSLISIRRYKDEAFVSWLEGHSLEVVCKGAYYEDSRVTGDGVYLVRRRRKRS